MATLCISRALAQSLVNQKELTRARIDFDSGRYFLRLSGPGRRKAMTISMARELQTPRMFRSLAAAAQCCEAIGLQEVTVRLPSYQEEIRTLKA